VRCWTRSAGCERSDRKEGERQPGIDGTVDSCPAEAHRADQSGIVRIDAVSDSVTERMGFHAN
jgi:hypothetical protein